MTIDRENLTMTRGDSESIRVRCENADGSPAPFAAGDRVYFTVKTSVEKTEKTLQKVVTAFTDGEAVISLAPEDTRNLTCRNYVYDVQLNRADGTVTTIIPPANFKIGSEVTDD